MVNQRMQQLATQLFICSEQYWIINIHYCSGWKKRRWRRRRERAKFKKYHRFHSNHCGFAQCVLYASSKAQMLEKMNQKKKQQCSTSASIHECFGSPYFKRHKKHSDNLNTTNKQQQINKQTKWSQFHLTNNMSVCVCAALCCAVLWQVSFSWLRKNTILLENKSTDKRHVLYLNASSTKCVF